VSEKHKGKGAVSPLMSELADYIATALDKPLPEAVAEKTRHHILDTLAAAISGSKLPPGKKAIAYAKRLGEAREATVAGSKVMVSAVHAALANGMLAHADETDDSHAPALMHPGCAIVPSALAMAERGRRNGTAMLRAVALGYDIAARINLSLQHIDFRRVGHLTHAFGPVFGAAAAAAALARLEPAQVRHALSYTGQQASGLSTYMRDTDHIEKAFDFGGMAARNGVSAVTMVASGCTGVEDVFSGERNFYIAFDESGRIGKAPEPDILVRGLGSNYEIMRTNIKRWSVGSPIQAPLDSLLELIRAHAIKAQDVETVHVRVSHSGANTVDNREMPDINMQHMVAVMLLDGIVTFESAHDEKRMKDRKVLELKKRVDLKGDDELHRLLPQRHGIVEIVMKDGRRLRHHTKAVRGTADNPMSRAEVDEKCYHLLKPVIGTKRARTLCDTVWNIERVKDARALSALLRV
jgi:2-methylcitrate dehydratase PrpD